MKTFWNDVYDNHDVWSALSINVNEVINPSLQLKSGTDLKFKLDTQDQTLFWGRIDHGFYGAWFLRNKTELPSEQSMIRSIKSTDIESIGFGDTFDKHKAWSRFFAQDLSSSSYSMLFEGKWLISSANITSSSHRDKAWQIMKPENAFSHGNPFWIDWNSGGAVGDLLPLKEEPHQGSGRVKWFRKLVKTGKCPPILCWYLNALDAFVILDGHCRLKAFIEEKVSPEILVLSAIQEQKIELDKVKQRHIYEAVSVKGKKISVEHANKLLIESFDNRPLISRISRSKAVRGLSTQWDDEVAKFKDSTDIDLDQLEAMSYIIEE